MGKKLNWSMVSVEKLCFPMTLMLNKDTNMLVVICSIINGGLWFSIQKLKWVKSSKINFTFKKRIQNKWILSEEHMVNWLTVNSMKLKMIYFKFLRSIQAKLAQMESLSLISSDVLINFTTFKFAIQKDKTLQLQEYTLKGFQIAFQKKVFNILLIYKKDWLFKSKTWSNKLKVPILCFLY